MDKRKALGDSPADDLPMPYPFDGIDKPEVEPPYTGKGNPAICSNRPIADLHPELGSGNINDGVSFRVPMGGPRWNDPQE